MLEIQPLKSEEIAVAGTHILLCVSVCTLLVYFCSREEDRLWLRLAFKLRNIIGRRNSARFLIKER